MSKSIVSERHNDCLPCRLVSGFGLLGISTYISFEAAKRKTNHFGRYSMYGIAAGIIS